MKHPLVCLALAVMALAAVAGLAFVVWPRQAPEPAQGSADPGIGPTAGIPWFEDVTAARGLDFQHFDSATPAHLLPEVFGSGIGWIDYDADGWFDLFCVQDGPLEAPKGDANLPTNKLYRNLGGGSFTDVTKAAGLDRSGFHMGCAVGDFDNDGYDDLLVTCVGGVVLYHNQPDGNGGRRFVDITAKAGLANPHWATSAAWGDVDGDGLLDLYVCNYVETDLKEHPRCFQDVGGQRVAMACAPTAFAATTHRLYRNDGNAKFTDISVPAGIAAAPPAPGLGVVMTDVDGDGRLDIYAANDLKPAYLFISQGKGVFAEQALALGCAMDRQGALIAGMGVDAGDVDGSGQPALLVTNFQKVPNVLFRRSGRFFDDQSHRSGLAGPSLNRLGFGTVFFDADLDGNLDVAVANGHVHRFAERIFAEPFAQEAQLFAGDGRGQFRDVSAQAGGYFRSRHVGRGLAWCDFDNDGLPDLALSNNGGPAVLLRNASATTNQGMCLELIGDGKKSNRNAVGARVEIECGGRNLVRWVSGGGSYLSASERRIVVGLGGADRAERVVVRWPSGRQQTFVDLSAGNCWRLYEDRAEPEVVRRAGAGGL